LAIIFWSFWTKGGPRLCLPLATLPLLRLFIPAHKYGGGTGNKANLYLTVAPISHKPILISLYWKVLCHSKSLGYCPVSPSRVKHHKLLLPAPYKLSSELPVHLRVFLLNFLWLKLGVVLLAFHLHLSSLSIYTI